MTEPTLQAVTAAARERERAAAAFLEALADARAAGATLQAIADAAGITRSGAHKLLNGIAAKRAAVESGETAKRERLAELDGRWESFVDRLAPAFTHPDARGEQARRNVENARARRQAAGVTRNGRRSGASGRKSVVRPTVANESRRLAELSALKFLEDRPDLDIVRLVLGELGEAAALRQELQAVDDSRVPFLHD